MISLKILTKKNKFSERYIEIRNPRPPQPTKVTKKFEILFIKVFSLKLKTKQILPANIEKMILCLQENSLICPFSP